MSSAKKGRKGRKGSDRPREAKRPDSHPGTAPPPAGVSPPTFSVIYSDPLAPSPGEQVLFDLHQMTGGREFESLDEVNEFLAAATRPGHPIPRPEPTTPLARAQQLAYDAFAATGPTRIELARRALDVSPDCADALILLAHESANDFKGQFELLGQAVDAGERALGGPDAVMDLAPEAWGHLEARPYLRALFGYALMQWELGARLAAARHLLHILELNENDNQGVRYDLLAWLLDIGDTVVARRLVTRYAKNGGSIWLWGDALLTLKERGDDRTARTRLTKALKANRIFAEYLTGRRKPPEDLPDQDDPGEMSEAFELVATMGRAWMNDRLAVDWLGGRMDAPAARKKRVE
ncbi:MAG: tetratricopeptide repeat protein [Thermoleophilia bacterium]